MLFDKDVKSPWLTLFWAIDASALHHIELIWHQWIFTLIPCSRSLVLALGSWADFTDSTWFAEVLLSDADTLTFFTWALFSESSCWPATSLAIGDTETRHVSSFFLYTQKRLFKNKKVDRLFILFFLSLSPLRQFQVTEWEFMMIVTSVDGKIKLKLDYEPERCLIMSKYLTRRNQVNYHS